MSKPTFKDAHLFPDCEISLCEQRSDEWYEIRRGILTASEFGPWLLKSDKTSAKARENAICKLVAQSAECWEAPIFQSEAMRRGIELEPVAVERFEKITSKKVNEVGFCRSVAGLFGCSPDGLIQGEPSGYESKAPAGGTHIKYRRAGTLPDEYKFQVHGSMAVTGAESWWFQSYEEKLAPFLILVERDDFTEELRKALQDFSAQLTEALAEEQAAWLEAYAREAA